MIQENKKEIDNKYIHYLILDYLENKGCSKTAIEFKQYITEKTPLETSKSLEYFEKDKKMSKNNSFSDITVLESIMSKHLSLRTKSSNKVNVEKEKENVKGKVKEIEIETDMNSSSNEIKWTMEEIKLLKEAVDKYKDITEKNKKWKLIRRYINTDKATKDCYEKYKELYKVKKEKKSVLFSNETSVTDHMDIKEKELYIKSNYLTNDMSIQLEDIDQINENQLVFPLQTNINIPNNTKKLYNYRDITNQEYMDLRILLFGDLKKSFPNEWKEQSFHFTNQKDLEYGLIQDEGGPCGVLAVVQGFIIQFILSHQIKDIKKNRNDALIYALGYCIWQARAITLKSVAYVAILNKKGKREINGIISDSVDLIEIHSFDDIIQVLNDHLNEYMKPKGPGILLFILSVIFTHGINEIKKEMDTMIQPTLIGAHYYCSQELVNLLLVGEACTNVFDDEKIIQSEDIENKNKDQMILKGISKQGEIGFLSLFESYDYIKVGNHLKCPRRPIWVICSESHYSVLYSKNTEMDIKNNDLDTFDLYYYDGLANQQEVITLTIKMELSNLTSSKISENKNKNNNELIPPLNLVIQTKWKNAIIDWNQTEPIL